MARKPRPRKKPGCGDDGVPGLAAEADAGIAMGTWPDVAGLLRALDLHGLADPSVRAADRTGRAWPGGPSLRVLARPGRREHGLLDDRARSLLVEPSGNRAHGARLGD